MLSMQHMGLHYSRGIAGAHLDGFLYTCSSGTDNAAAGTEIECAVKECTDKITDSMPIASTALESIVVHTSVAVINIMSNNLQACASTRSSCWCPYWTAELVSGVTAYYAVIPLSGGMPP